MTRWEHAARAAETICAVGDVTNRRGETTAIIDRAIADALATVTAERDEAREMHSQMCAVSVEHQRERDRLAKVIAGARDTLRRYRELPPPLRALAAELDAAATGGRENV